MCCCRTRRSIADADERLVGRVERHAVERIVAEVPAEWLGAGGGDVYVDYLVAAPRDAARSSWRRQSPPVAEPFSYAILRLVPDIERGERLNVGVVALLPAARLRGRADMARRGRARALGADARPRGRAPASRRDRARRRRATPPQARSPRSTRRRGSTGSSPRRARSSSRREVHTGLCDDPAACLDELFERLVR